MKRYLAALFTLLLLAAYVAVQRQCHPGWDPPNWYHLFKWPDGVTAWAVILTLVVIADQTNETRRAAEAAAKQVDTAKKALILQFRPTLQIRAIRLDETDDSLSIEIVVVNKGGTNAYLQEGTVSLDWLWSRSSKSHVATAKFEEATVKPGAQESLQVILNEHWIMYKFSKEPKYASGMRLRCEGTLLYKDENGVVRRTGFSRLRNAVTTKWEVDSDQEYEYFD